MDHDALYGQRLLQSQRQRHHLPRRHSAIAALRRERQPGGESRRHRLHHRPRDHPRLRQQWCEVRRERQRRRLVDGGGLRRLPAEVSGCGRMVRRAGGLSRHRVQRRTDDLGERGRPRCGEVHRRGGEEARPPRPRQALPRRREHLGVHDLAADARVSGRDRRPRPG